MNKVSVVYEMFFNEKFGMLDMEHYSSFQGVMEVLVQDGLHYRVNSISEETYDHFEN